MLNTVEMADAYFAKNLFGKAKWEALTEGNKELVLETAENDVNAYLKTFRIDPNVIKTVSPFSVYQMAVFEWALFLSENKDDIKNFMKQKGYGLTSTEVTGVGKEAYSIGSYRRPAYHTLMLQSRAGQYLSALQHEYKVIR